MTKQAFFSLFASAALSMGSLGASPDYAVQYDTWVDRFFEQRAPEYAHVRTCLEFSAEYFHLPLELLVSVMLVENGITARKRRNNNQTYDYGIFQINDARIPEISYMGVTEEVLIHDDCLNAYVGSYLLYKEIHRAGDFWEGVGNYHYGLWGRFPQHHYAYIERVHRVWKNLLQ